MSRKKQSGLGKGLDSLIPDFYDEDFDSNNSLSLEEMLDDDATVEIEEPPKEEDSQVNEQENVDEVSEENTDFDEENSEDLVEQSEEEFIEHETVEEIVDDAEEDFDEIPREEVTLSKKELANIDEVKEVVSKNPRITLWSAQSAAVFRYLRKTEPEFSISKEASLIIEDAVSKKYPEIWKLFDED